MLKILQEGMYVFEKVGIDWVCLSHDSVDISDPVIKGFLTVLHDRQVAEDKEKNTPSHEIFKRDMTAKITAHCGSRVGQVADGMFHEDMLTQEAFLSSLINSLPELDYTEYTNYMEASALHTMIAYLMDDEIRPLEYEVF